MADWDVELALELKNRNNPTVLGPIIGKVVSPPPDIKISILEGKVFITKCYAIDSLLGGYSRTISIPVTAATGTTDSVNDGGDGASSHSHNITTLGLQEVKWILNDTLKSGDEVLLIPTNDNQTYFIVGKVMPLGGK